MSDSNQDKLTTGVTEFLSGTDTDNLSVLIEIDLPKPTFTVSPLTPGEMQIRSRGKFENIPEKKDIEESVDQAKMVLEETLGRSLNWLEAPHVFVGELTRDELRVICELEFVKQIHQNRDLLINNPSSDSTE